MRRHSRAVAWWAAVLTFPLAVAVAGSSPANAGPVLLDSVETGSIVNLPQSQLYYFGSVSPQLTFQWSVAAGDPYSATQIWVYGSSYSPGTTNWAFEWRYQANLCAVDATALGPWYRSDAGVVPTPLYPGFIVLKTASPPTYYAAIQVTKTWFDPPGSNSGYLNGTWWLQTDGTGTFCGNQPPTADAGGPYVAAVNASFPVNGSASSDPESDSLSYAWTFEGQAASGVSPTLTAPATPGIYTLDLTVDDGKGNSDTASTTVVVYDPSAGFVTGGGWINSPPGAFTADASMAGKASFGFVSKYQKGATAPSGHTAFEFTTGALDFESTSYDWLVVNQAGANAQFKGSGTINDTGNYQFMVWASDNSPDTFRIKLWYEDASQEIVVYDNGTGQPLQGGSIIIHTTK